MLVDTTCGSVLNVWKRVESYARDGYTAVIHGKHYHEETQGHRQPGDRSIPAARYLVVLNMDEARIVCDFIEQGGDAAGAGRAIRRRRCRPASTSTRDLVRVGVANQTTMLSGESLAIAEEFGASMARRYGADGARRALPLVRHDLLARRRSGRTRCSRCSRSRST